MEAGSITREELYELVWAMPMTKVAEKFQVSGSYLARACTALQVPRPERGYWAKLAVGKASKAPQLPEAQPGDPMVWMRTEGLPVPSVHLLVTLPLFVAQSYANQGCAHSQSHWSGRIIRLDP